MRWCLLHLKRQFLSCDKESVLKKFIWLCHENICLCFNHLQVFTIKPLDIKHNECLTTLLFVDVEWNDQNKIKEEIPNWYVVTQNISSQTSEEFMKEAVKRKEHQLRILNLDYIGKKRPPTHYFVLLKERKHRMWTKINININIC